ncbi:MAG: hypothetical protein J5737_03655 [Bacteroidales bacterium]|nr:hypothetical protein [Bacteroidales bacterium]
MKKSLSHLFAILFSVFAFFSCNGNKNDITGPGGEPQGARRLLSQAVAEDLGKVAGQDGYIYDDAKAAAAGGTTAVAMIAYVGSGNDKVSCAHGLAIALKEDKDGTGLSYEEALSFQRPTVAGADWRLPSTQDWQIMFKACGSPDDIIPDGSLNNASRMNAMEFQSKLKALGSGFKEGSYSYWSSTKSGAQIERPKGSGIYYDQVWSLNFSFVYCQFGAGYIDVNCICRGCLVF